MFATGLTEETNNLNLVVSTVCVGGRCVPFVRPATCNGVCRPTQACALGTAADRETVGFADSVSDGIHRAPLTFATSRMASASPFGKHLCIDVVVVLCNVASGFIFMCRNLTKIIRGFLQAPLFCLALASGFIAFSASEKAAASIVYDWTYTCGDPACNGSGTMTTLINFPGDTVVKQMTGHIGGLTIGGLIPIPSVDSFEFVDNILSPFETPPVNPDHEIGFQTLAAGSTPLLLWIFLHGPFSNDITLFGCPDVHCAILGDTSFHYSGTFSLAVDHGSNGGGDIPTTPLPSALVLFGSGLASVVLLARRRKAAAAA